MYCGQGVYSLPFLWYFFEEHCLAAFSRWPFDSGCSCILIRMVEAGFIHCPSENASDVVQCIICFKELEAWEPEDDPVEEHQKHPPNCEFLAL
uniref:Baculoviral IAP repeat-containing protein 5 n=1 Tax=Salvator merianae TaxID=96440 RepID=A0A8D0CA38_SALMN